MALTDIAIKKAEGNSKPYKLADAGGMYLWVTPAGGRSWRWNYRFDGKQKLMTLGPFPRFHWPPPANGNAGGRKLLANGIDPMEQRKSDKTAERLATENSFAAVATQWLDYWRVGKSPRHADYTDRRLTVDVIPVLGDRPITEIQASELVRMVKAIEARGARDNC